MEKKRCIQCYVHEYTKMNAVSAQGEVMMDLINAVRIIKKKVKLQLGEVR